MWPDRGRRTQSGIGQAFHTVARWQITRHGSHQGGGGGRAAIHAATTNLLPAPLAHLEQHALGEGRVGVDRIGAQVAQHEK